MVEYDKTLLGLEKSILKKHQNFIDAFSKLLEQSSNFNWIKNVPDTEKSDIEKKISRESVPVVDGEKGYGLEDIQKDLEALVSIAQRDELQRVDYVDVTRVVLNIYKEVEEAPEFLGDFLMAMESQYQLILLGFKKSTSTKSHLSLIESQKQGAIICVGKAIEHARLAHVQYNSLYLQTQDEVKRIQDAVEENFYLYWGMIADKDKAEKDIEDLKKDIKNVKDDIEKDIGEYKEEFKKMSDKQSSLYTDFIAILGVFSSFVFVMFGGFSSLSDIISSLRDDYISVEKILLISSFLMGSMFTIIYSLIVWVSKIIEKPIVVKSCSCKGECTKFGHAWERHKFYSTIMIGLTILFGVSLLFVIFLNR